MGIGAAYGFSIVKHAYVAWCAIIAIVTALSTNWVARPRKTTIPSRRAVPDPAAGVAGSHATVTTALLPRVAAASGTAITAKWAAFVYVVCILLAKKGEKK